MTEDKTQRATAFVSGDASGSEFHGNSVRADLFIRGKSAGAKFSGNTLNGVPYQGEQGPPTTTDENQIMTDAEKLKAIAQVAGETGVGADEHAVVLAIEVLAIIDGSVTSEQVETQVFAARYPMTVGEAFAAAVASIGGKVAEDVRQ